MNDGAAGEIDGAPVEQPAISGIHGTPVIGKHSGFRRIVGRRGKLGEEVGCRLLANCRLDRIEIVGRQGVGVRPGPEPHHVCHRQIGEGEPKDDEQQHRGEFHALGEGTDDERRRYRGEGELEHHIGELRHIDPLGKGRGERRYVNAGEKEFRQAAEECRAAGEGNRIAVEHPENTDEREADEHLGENREHVLGAHQSAIEQGKTRDRHQDDENGGDQHPSRVALIDGRRRLGGTRRKHGRQQQPEAR